VRITVLGKSPAWQDADGACSGYLVEAGDQTVLLDCGPGVFAKLRRFVDYLDVDAVVISHLHADHILDLVPFASGLRYAPRQQPVPVAGFPGTDEPVRPRLIAPPGALDAFAALCSAGSMTADHIELAFDITVYDPADVVEVGPLRARFQPVPHFVPCNAVELAADGARLTFSADCAPSDALVEFAAGTDLLLIEATLPRPERDGDRGHLTPAEAGEHGARAGARRLVLTHFSDELDAAWACAEAERTFGRPVDAAHEGARYLVGG
jgi:ribonuclease BN (tRNA processing enzyme)